MANLFDYAGWGTTVTIPRNPRPSIQGGPDGRAGTLFFNIGLSSVGDFLAFCAGADETIPLAGGGSIVRRVPLRHPDDNEMFIDSYDVSYFGEAMADVWAPGKSIHTEQFSIAQMRANFLSLPLGVGGDQPYYTISTESSATMEMIPGNSFLTASGRPMTDVGSLPIPTTTIIITTFLSPTPISYTLANLVGRINSTAVDFGVYGTYPAGTLRFDGAAQDLSAGSAGSSAVKRFILKHRPVEWNKVLNDLGVWEVAYARGNNQPKYLSADLNILKAA